MNPASTPEEVQQEVKRLVAELTECEPEEVTGSAHFADDLDIDSLTAIELMVALDKKYNIDIPDEEFQQVETLDQTVEIVLKHLSTSKAVA